MRIISNKLNCASVGAIPRKLSNPCIKVANEISEKDMNTSFKIIDKINKDSYRRAEKLGLPIKTSRTISDPQLYVGKELSGGDKNPAKSIIYIPPEDRSRERWLPGDMSDAILFSSAVTNAEAIKRGNIVPIGRYHDVSGYVDEIGNAIKFPKSVIKKYLYAHYHLDDSPSNEVDIERMGILGDLSDSMDIFNYLENHKGSNKEFMDKVRTRIDDSDLTGSSNVRNAYVESMARRAQGKRGKENDAYSIYHNILHKDLRLNPEEERDTVARIRSNALKRVPSSAGVGALTAGIPALAYTMIKHKAKPSRGAIAGTALATLIGSAMGGRVGYSSRFDNEVNKHYLYETHYQAKDKEN